jgi:hypothetical protein
MKDHTLKKIICILILSMIFFAGCVENNKDENKVTESKFDEKASGNLTLTIQMTKSIFKLNESIVLTLSLQNNDNHIIKVQPLMLGFNYVIIIRDNNSKEIQDTIHCIDYFISMKNMIELQPTEFTLKNFSISDYFKFNNNDTQPYFVNTSYVAHKLNFDNDTYPHIWIGQVLSNTIEFRISN